MKKVLLLMVVSAALVALGFAQTPDAGSNTGQVNIQGCLGGSGGNYTVAEDGSGQIFKITTSSVDLKPHLTHEVKLIGHKATEGASSGLSVNSFAVTELNMISEHCAAAAGAPAATVSPASDTVIAPAATGSPSSTPVSTPAVEAAVPAATASVSSPPVSTPAANVAEPAATVTPSSAPVATPTEGAAQPSTTVTPSSAPISPAVDAGAPAAKATHPMRRSAHPRKQSAIQTAAAKEPAAAVSPSETVSPPAADAGISAVTASPAPEAANPPAAAAATTPAATHKSGLLWLLILFVALVVALGTLVPLLGRWRKRKLLERTGTPNLSFTNEAISDRDKTEPRKAA